MLRQCFAIILALSAPLAASAQLLPTAPSKRDVLGSASPQAKTVYFVIDASDSMEDAQVAADQAIKVKMTEYGANPPAMSYTYFQGCRTKIEISDPGINPQRPIARGGTPLGAALAAVLSSAKDGPADIFLVTDARQTESCGPDICTVAHTLLPKSNIEVTLIPVNSSPQDRDRLACIEGAQSGAALSAPETVDIGSPVGSTKAAVVEHPNAPEPIDESPAASRGHPLPFIESLPWMVLVILFASAFYLFGDAFNKSARHVEKKLNTLQADLESGDTKLPKPTFPVAKCLFGLAALVSLALLWVPWSALDFARAGANDTLNTQFGSSVFLAGLLMLVGFAGSQYWRYTELRRSYGVATNEAERDKKAKEEAASRQKIDLLYASYLRQRSLLLDRDYHLDRVLTAGAKRENNASLLQRIVDGIKFVALGPELQPDRVTIDEVNRISRFNAFLSDRTFTGLVAALSSGRLPQEIATAISGFLNTKSIQDSDGQSAALNEIVASLEPLLTPNDTTSELDDGRR